MYDTVTTTRLQVLQFIRNLKVFILLSRIQGSCSHEEFFNFSTACVILQAAQI